MGEQASSYLRRHRDDPVAWQPCGSGAFEQARREDKPVLVSIGFLACHWCHVMAEESFSDPAIAPLLDTLCVTIKVDREELPNVDRLVLSAQASGRATAQVCAGPVCLAPIHDIEALRAVVRPGGIQELAGTRIGRAGYAAAPRESETTLSEP